MLEVVSQRTGCRQRSELGFGDDSAVSGDGRSELAEKRSFIESSDYLVDASRLIAIHGGCRTNRFADGSNLSGLEEALGADSSDIALHRSPKVGDSSYFVVCID